MVNKGKHPLRSCSALFLATIILTGVLSGCNQDNDPAQPSTAPDQSETQTVPETEAPKILYYGTVITDELNVRENVGISHEVIATLKEGTRVAVLEEQDLNGVMWGRIETGWICLVYVHIDGTPLDEKPEEKADVLDHPAMGKVIATELNIRTGPGTNYGVCNTVLKDAELTVTEVKGNWGKTDAGWVNIIFVYFPDSLDSEVMEARVSTDELNVRSGPSTDYESLRKLNTGDLVTIYKQVLIRNTQWGYIGDGWLCMDYVEIQE